MIYESSLHVATNADLLASPSRLDAIPYNGKLTLRFIASACDASNFGQLTIQLPNGVTPVDNQVVQACSPPQVADERELLQFSFSATQGGHYIVSWVETGTVILLFQAILTP